jgi:2-polyprenyl-6-methoxyphenol hydroxylase-like FAD-dependent oxidoreductase
MAARVLPPEQAPVDGRRLIFVGAGMAEDVVIVGAGICGLALALNLHSRGIPVRVFERVPDVKELGVGITVLPHAMREFAELGVADKLQRSGIENVESCFFNRFGQLIYKEPRGKHAGYAYPEVGLPRGRLHMILYEAALERLGPEAIRTDHDCIGVEQDDTGATALFRSTSTGAPLPPVRGAGVIACDGINSNVRKQLYPGDKVAFAGINTWRGVTRMDPILGGRTYMRVGSIRTGKLVIYPIADDVDRTGKQLVNWVAEIEGDVLKPNDWNKPGDLADFHAIYADWRFDWLDVPQMLRGADMILEYPMVDKDPLPRWTFGRVTLAGDAAHPMYPRGSNGAAQAALDARTLADCLAQHGDAAEALEAYEAARREAANRVVMTNREQPPDFINIKVEELVGDRPFDNLNDYITQDELRRLSDEYKRVAGFAAPKGGS